MALNDIIKYGFKNLNKVGIETKLPELLTDDQLYRISKTRFHFYQQLWDELNNPNSQIADRVFGIANRNRYTIEQLNDAITGLTRDVDTLAATTSEDSDGLAKQLNPALQKNIFLKDFEFKKFDGGAFQNVDELSEKLDEAQYKIKKQPNGPEGNQFEQEFSKFRLQYEQDPTFAPLNAQITTADRIIFIAITFLFRGISLFLVEWGMNSYMFRGFKSALTYYFLFYLSMLFLLYFIVNGSTTFHFFRMMFYYLSSEPPNGYGRLLAHCAILVFLMPIFTLVKDTTSQEDENDNSFERRRAVMRTMNTFTLFAWLLTSIVAIAY
ncbi:MAG: hypothetical protein ACO222_07295 [Polynucleobacter sp.]